ncbi:hypothetical protein CYMTET_56597 [Cymbomonas tetramitiformis]|uniref:Uncharacterized protein n=1 Tax=Cymbomonas tetramitiformis TaxID=36881 RepID=A0AAE0BBW1_9CHLO|nr:hypothetical protein CYMTET_56597 [Cymbomonas tetramitiformis]
MGVKIRYLLGAYLRGRYPTTKEEEGEEDLGVESWEEGVGWGGGLGGGGDGGGGKGGGGDGGGGDGGGGDGGGGAVYMMISPISVLGGIPLLGWKYATPLRVYVPTAKPQRSSTHSEARQTAFRAYAYNDWLLPWVVIYSGGGGAKVVGSVEEGEMKEVVVESLVGVAAMVAGDLVEGDDGGGGG